MCTHPGEEEILIESFIDLKKENKHLVLAPRHPERFNEIKELLQEKKLTSIFYTQISSNPNDKSDVTIVDVIGRPITSTIVTSLLSLGLEEI